MKQKNKDKIPVVVIFAPTASGKTALTRELFTPEGSHFVFKAEIVSADSQAVYKGMDIGTAKPDKELVSILPHHCVDLVTPDVQFNVADFVNNADIACMDIYRRGGIPVVCGGTGFYIRSFLYGLPKTPESTEEVRQRVQTQLKTLGREALYAQLETIDPVSAKKIHINDEYRICRALEVFYTTGKPRSEYLLEAQLRPEYDFTFIVLEPPRELLFSRIAERVNMMFDAGLENEIRTLEKLGYTKETPGMSAIGYREFFEETDIEKIKQNIIHNSCKYAKKQFTYIRDIPQSKIFSYTASSEDLKTVAEYLQKTVSEP